MDMTNWSVRTLVLDVFIPDDEKRALRQKVVNSIKQYRHICCHLASLIFVAESTSSKVEAGKDGTLRVMPNNEAAKEVLTAVFAKTGKAPYYEFREYVLKELAPTWRSFLWDQCREQITSNWRSKDAQYPKATRGYLAHQGVRNIPKFSNVGLPILRTTTVLNNAVFEGMAMTLTWDKEVGPIKFVILGKRSKIDRKRRLDGSRAMTWRKIVSGEWPACTVRITENDDGGFRVLIPYKLPPQDQTLDKEKVLEVAIIQEIGGFFKLSVREGKETIIDFKRNIDIPINQTVAWIDGLDAQKQKLQILRASCGRRRDIRFGTGHAKAYGAVIKREENLAASRLNGSRSWNHVWTKKIVEIAKSWGCGSIRIYDLPAHDTAVESEKLSGLLGRPWQWADFKSKLEYKAKSFGVEVEYVASPLLAVAV